MTRAASLQNARAVAAPREEEGAEIMPSKLVCVKKPPNSDGMCRKRARICVCGNYASEYGEVYTSQCDAASMSRPR